MIDAERGCVWRHGPLLCRCLRCDHAATESSQLPQCVHVVRWASAARVAMAWLWRMRASWTDGQQRQFLQLQLQYCEAMSVMWVGVPLSWQINLGQLLQVGAPQGIVRSSLVAAVWRRRKMTLVAVWASAAIAVRHGVSWVMRYRQ